MTHPLIYAADSFFSPADIQQLAILYDEVWASVAADGVPHPDRIFGDRRRLATIILKLAADGQFSAIEITRIAGRLMRTDESVPVGRVR